MGSGFRTGGPDRSDEYEDRRPPPEERANAMQAVQEAIAEAEAAMNRRRNEDGGEGSGSEEESSGGTSVREVAGIGPTIGSRLENAGFRTIAALRSASHEQLVAISGIGARTAERIQTAASAQAPAPSLEEAVERTIEETSIAGTTPNGEEQLRGLFQSSAREFASRIKDPAIARRLFEHIAEVRQHNREGPSTGVTAGTERTVTRVTLTEDSTRDDAIHEYTHAFADAYGYTDGRLGKDAARTYRLTDRDPDGPNDPFVVIDPEEPECRLLQDHGEVVEDTPQELQQLMGAVNTAWSRIQRQRQAGTNPRDYTVLDNYSATTASEFLTQLTEFMQSETTPTRGTEILSTQPEVVEAYQDVFEPSEAVQALLDEQTDG